MVKSCDRKESPAEFINSAHELEKLTMQLTLRENAIPKRYRYILGQPLCTAARDLNRNIVYANGIYVNSKDTYQVRRKYQVKARLILADYFELMRLAFELLPIKTSVMDEWQALANKEQRALIGWIEADSKRYKEFI